MNKLTIEKCENGYLVTGTKPNDNPRSASEFTGEIKRVFSSIEEVIEFVGKSLS